MYIIPIPKILLVTGVLWITIVKGPFVCATAAPQIIKNYHLGDDKTCQKIDYNWKS